MGTRIKGIYKGFKHTLSQIFVVKEREMEIGYPTDVKHLAHIGWDGPSGNAPTWMSEFRTVPDFIATSIGNSGSALSPWSSVEGLPFKFAIIVLADFGEIMRKQSEVETFKELTVTELPITLKKQQKRKKSKSTSSPNYSSSSSSRAAKTKAKLICSGRHTWLVMCWKTECRGCGR